MTRTPAAVTTPAEVGRHSDRSPSRLLGTVSRRARIVSTVGPATHPYECNWSLVEAGMDMARLDCARLRGRRLMHGATGEGSRR
ncbi:hypothetical protein SAMN05660350_03847 [Geodermatophilus obscurus]|uniref:Uncharacterized protein n=1 Tax=Geodermatophilus obscurus TaxID=1861 RepID=A0A1M7USF9_9ACTN|nr:hypothetical protein SAMN05660350_03847 [Geodermatophilus obscurus]